MATEEAQALATLDDVAALFGLSPKLVNYFLYSPKVRKYRTFEIKKRLGGTRTISAPIFPIKTMQRAFAKWLSARFKPHSHAHGYVDKRDIITNADHHVGRRWVLRVDLKEFFPTIHFGRVRGLLLSPPYSLPEDVATLLAHLCCNEGALPQGAPSSPAISNLVCRRLDRELAKLAGLHRCRYTRYADDLVFSTNQRAMPSPLVGRDSQTQILSVGGELRRIVEGNGFVVNDEKTRLYPRNQRQLVTGIVVNKCLNVTREYLRSLRDQIHAFKKHGAAVAEKLILATYKKNRPVPGPPDFLEVLRGRVQHVGHVRGWGNAVYRRLALSLAEVDQGFRPMPVAEVVTGPLQPGAQALAVRVYCEGVSDYDHFEAADRSFRAAGGMSGVELHFERASGIDGDSHLLATCESASKTKHDHPHMFVFDRDNLPLVAKVTDNGGGIKDWGNGVYSFCIARPPWRPAPQKICVEMLYSDGDLSIKDHDGRRVFLRSEFDENSGRHADPDLTNPHMRDSKLVAEKVWDAKGNRNVALAKASFSRAVLNKTGGFAHVSFAGFEGTLNLVREAAAKWLARPQASS